MTSTSQSPRPQSSISCRGNNQARFGPVVLFVVSERETFVVIGTGHKLNGLVSILFISVAISLFRNAMRIFPILSVVQWLVA